MGYSLRQRGYLSGSIGGRTGRALGTWYADTSNLLTTSERAYAHYLGKYDHPITAIDLIPYIHGAAAGTTGWAEVAIATSPAWSGRQASVDLTVVGYSSIDTEVKAGATAAATKSVTGLSIPAGTDLWGIVAASYDTTQASFRIINAGEVWGFNRTRNSFRPSSNVGTAAAFAFPAASSCPLIRAVVP